MVLAILGYPQESKPKRSGGTNVTKKRVFLSFCFNDSRFVHEVNACLVLQPEIKTYFYPEQINGTSWPQSVKTALIDCDAFVLFLGSTLGNTQEAEALIAASSNNISAKIIVITESADSRTLPEILPPNMGEYMRLDPIRVVNSGDWEKCAKEIIHRLGVVWSILGIPEEYPFEYEKDIIGEYIKGNGRVSPQLLYQGCPEEWPDVDHKSGQRENPVPAEVIGAYRDWDTASQRYKNPRVLVAALSDYHEPHSSGCPLKEGLTFAEAGPRKQHFFPRRNDNLTVGILVSGGIAPGLNAVLAGIIDRHVLYFDSMRSSAARLKIHCYREGFNSLTRGYGPDYQFFSLTKVPGQNDDRQALRNLSQQSYRGGTIVPTARTPELLESSSYTKKLKAFSDVVASLKGDGVDLLYVVGGDGSMKAAHAIQNCAHEQQFDLSVVAVPKTMDNDILWVWQSFGFPSAVEWAKDAICNLHTEVTSNPRLCVIQLFGSDSGFVVCHAALASGVCDLVLIPEVEFEMESLVRYIKDTLRLRHGRGINGRSPYSVLLMSETAIPKTMQKESLEDADFELSDLEKKAVENFFAAKRRVKGQTPDELRGAGLKIVVGAAKKAIRQLKETDPYWDNFRVFTNEPRHLLRAIPPSSSDILFARRLGALAVDCAMAGYHDFMISQWLTEYVMVPLELVILGRKRIPRSGIFWKSVLASTGQPADMTR
jgi:6-phosphofructokinase 1